MWVWLDKLTPDWMLECRDSLAQPNFILTTAVSWICHWRVSVSVTDPHNRLLVTRCLQWSSKVLGPLWITNSGLHFKQMSPMLFTEHYKHQKWMWKWNNQHVTSVGQRKTLSPRQDSNLWPPKHRAGALSTWATQPFRLKFSLGHHLATNSFGLGRLFYKSSRQLQNFRRHGD